ncbi:MAG: glucose-1-phosphate thymidylyltransferase, partial [Candidatus Micrarchaeota archaeon]|nr:glucose-1-phosphate thymidylyltransferase [Candidatus Micrarchaeota archaeon]
DYVRIFDEKDYDAFILFKEVEDPRMFGVAKFEGKKLVGLVEKPKEPPSKYAIVGVYMFKPIVFEVIKELKPSWRGELEITDAIQGMIDKGYSVGYSIIKGWWFDTGKAEDILKVNATILDERAKREIKGEILNSSVDGRVEIGEGTKVVNSTIRGPAIIGNNCLIENSFIGPYTSVGDNIKIFNSALEYCIVLNNSTIENVERIEDSLIGKNVSIRKNDKYRFLKLRIGDYSEILL